MVGLVLTCSSLKFPHTGVRCMCVICILLYYLSQVSPDSGLYVMLFHFSCLTSEVMYARTFWMYSTTIADFIVKVKFFFL